MEKHLQMEMPIYAHTHIPVEYGINTHLMEFHYIYNGIPYKYHIPMEEEMSDGCC